MRILLLILLCLIALVQYSLWLGKGGWLQVWDLDRQIKVQQETNHKMQARNAAIDADVRDLKQGYAAIEERARSELGMIKDDEVFFQVIQSSPSASGK
ncbi:MAG: cell division protein FtsB [Burkholderiales bacterium]|nr:cell division protein FtsB [Burkholderiales bacterium]